MAYEGQARNHPSSRQLKHLSYQAAFQQCHREDLAEETANHTLAQVNRHSSWFSKQTPLDQKGFIGLISTYYVLKDTKGEVKPEEAEEKEGESVEKAKPEDLILTYQTALREMPAKELSLFLLAVHFHLSDEVISKLVSQPAGQVSREIERISEDLSEKVQDDEVEARLRRSSMQKACAFQIKTLVDRLEAFAALNEHTFKAEENGEEAPAQDESAQKQAADQSRANRPVYAPQSAHVGMNEMNKQPHRGGLSPQDVEQYAPRNAPKTKLSNKSAYYISGILAILVLLVLARFTIFKPNDSEQASSSALSSGELTSESISEETPVANETRSIPGRYYGVYDNTILFVDPEDNTVYEYPKGGDVKKVLAIDELASEHAGIHHIGKVDDVIYLAFMDGKGAHISGDPAEATMEPYWQKDWFEGQIEGQPQLEEPLIYDGVAYQFEGKED